MNEERERINEVEGERERERESESGMKEHLTRNKEPEAREGLPRDPL